MKLAEATWKEVSLLSREQVVLIPTGSMEQHGTHLPLQTDTLIVEAVANAAEGRIPEQVLMCPTLWLGASDHHLPFAGSLSSSFEAYSASLESVISSLQRHRFTRFLVLNGHGGNTDLNSIVLRRFKNLYPNQTFAHTGYFELITDAISESLKGPLKHISHACEAETSLVMHLRPDLVRRDNLRDDGMRAEPPISGLVFNFDELSDEGSIGCSTYASPETGAKIFDAAVQATSELLQRMANSYVMVEAKPSKM